MGKELVMDLTCSAIFTSIKEIGLIIASKEKVNSIEMENYFFKVISKTV